MIAPAILVATPVAATTSVVPDYDVATMRTRFGVWMEETIVAPGLVSLPFAFPFYGASKSSVHVSTNGILTFDGPVSGSPSGVNLRTQEALAPLWSGTPASGTVTQALADDETWVRFTWALEGASGLVLFSAQLFWDGRIRFDYGDDTVSPTPQRVIGVSNGLQTASVIVDGAQSVAARDSIVLSPKSLQGAPSLTLSKPLPGRIYIGNVQNANSVGSSVDYALVSGALTIQASATAPIGTPTLKLYVGRTLLATSTTGSLSHTWTPPSNELGVYSLLIVANDDVTHEVSRAALDLVATAASMTVANFVAPVATVLFPNGGEYITTAGTKPWVNIVSLCDKLTIQFDLSKNEGEDWTQVFSRNYGGYSLFPWSLPPMPWAAFDSGEALARVRVTTPGCAGQVAATATDTSDDLFTIDFDGRSVRLVDVASPSSLLTGWHTSAAALSFLAASSTGDEAVTLTRAGSSLGTVARTFDGFEGPVPSEPPLSTQWQIVSVPSGNEDEPKPDNDLANPQGDKSMRFEFATGPDAYAEVASYKKEPSPGISTGSFERARLWVYYDVNADVVGEFLFKLWSGSTVVAEISGTATPRAWLQVEDTTITTGATVTKLTVDFNANVAGAGSLPSVLRQKFYLDGLVLDRPSLLTESADGARVWKATVSSSAGSETTPDETVRVDLYNPTGQITSINNGATYVAEQAGGAVVTLVIAASDSASGVKEMMFSNSDTFAGGVWEPYATTKTWTLQPLTPPATSAERSVYVQFRDFALHTGLGTPDSILVDGQGPVAGTNYSPGTAWQSSGSVTVSLDFTENLDVDTASAEVAYSPSSQTPSSYQPATYSGTGTAGTVTKPITIAEEGQYNVRFRLKDEAGNTGTSSSKLLKIDLQAPSCSITFNVDYSRDTGVPLDWTSSDGGMSGTANQQISNYADFHDATWGTYSSPVVPTDWTILGVEGYNYVYARFEDHVGHVSDACNDRVIYDTHKPIVTPVSPAPGATGIPIVSSPGANPPTNRIKANWADDTSVTSIVSGVDYVDGLMYLKPFGGAEQLVAATKTPTGLYYDPPVLLPQTTYTVRIVVADNAGNEENGATWLFSTA